MKLVIVLLLAITAAVAIPIDEDRQSGEGGWYVPQLDGSFQWMTVDEAQELLKEASGRLVPTSVYFHLYTNAYPTTSQTLITGNIKSLQASHFNKAYPTRIIIHGWQSDSQSNLNAEIRDAYFSRSKFNIIVVDWSDQARSLMYTTSKGHVPDVGQQVASFIDFLHKEGGLSFDTLHVIGHSLGAHIAGFAGKNVKYGRINQITGLDPAYPLFSYNTPTERLSEFDADYVETIQTCGGMLGFLQPIGQSTFYPNGGKSQPGCGFDLTGMCAHKRSWMYYAEAIRKNSFPAVKCQTYTNAVKNTCGRTYSSVRMAASYNFANALGAFYVPVNNEAPYGMGY